jgi:hypothetical protein
MVRAVAEVAVVSANLIAPDPDDVAAMIVCDACGCTVTVDTARDRNWGTIGNETGKRVPSCSRECAEHLYSLQRSRTQGLP